MTNKIVAKDMGIFEVRGKRIKIKSEREVSMGVFSWKVLIQKQ